MLFNQIVNIICDITVRVDDLKHPFGRRLLVAGVIFEDRKELIRHKSGRITTHYSAAELVNLLNAANKVCKDAQDIDSPSLTLLRCKIACFIPAQANGYSIMKV